MCTWFFLITLKCGIENKIFLQNVPFIDFTRTYIKRRRFKRKIPIIIIIIINGMNEIINCLAKDLVDFSKLLYRNWFSNRWFIFNIYRRNVKRREKKKSSNVFIFFFNKLNSFNSDRLRFRVWRINATVRITVEN